MYHHRAVLKKISPDFDSPPRLLPPRLRTLSIPPGLTHDEAGHGHDAANILKGVTPIYFTVGYGREPLFDYLNAGLIAVIGANILTLRFAAVAWGMITLALTYRVARTAFDRNTAIIALALMSVSFWQLATRSANFEIRVAASRDRYSSYSLFKINRRERKERREKK